MAGVINATVTGTMGPGNAITAGSFPLQGTAKFDAVKAMLELVDLNDKVTNISIAAATTITITLSGAAGNYTLTVS